MGTKTATKPAAKKPVAKKAAAKKPAGLTVTEQIALVVEQHDLKKVELDLKKPYDEAVGARKAVDEKINDLIPGGLTFDVPGVGPRESSVTNGTSVGYKDVVDKLKVIFGDSPKPIDPAELVAKIDELVAAHTTKTPRITFKNATGG